jgi:hypothetical protein
MNVRLVIASMAVSVLASSFAVADGDLLEIKGFHVGMKNWEVTAHEHDFCYAKSCPLSHKTPFTVGGVTGRFFNATYDDSATANLVEFGFDSFGFQNLRNALVEKYPGTKCRNSEVITRLGLHVPQVVCRYETDKDGIYLMRVAGNINRSLLFIMSAEKREEVKEHIVAANHDL